MIALFYRIGAIALSALGAFEGLSKTFPKNPPIRLFGPCKALKGLIRLLGTHKALKGLIGPLRAL